MTDRWHDLGAVAEWTRELETVPVRQVAVGRTKIALSLRDGEFAAVSGVCNHAGGPLGEGRLDGDYLVCPWHGWKFHRATGEGEPGFEEDRVPRYELSVRDGHLWIDLEARSTRHKKPHEPHPLARRSGREPGPVRVLGLSTTVMNADLPRYSTSDALLETALEAARQSGAEAKLIHLRDLQFRSCEGYYSKSAHACTWPCSITQMDPNDQLDRVYEGLVHWADVILVATPIRWGAPSALYAKMVERMNCIQNQVTIANRVLLRNKVAAFLITGGQDNIQAVAGQMLGFFAELGCVFPQFPYIAHSRGWSAEDMERNIAYVQQSAALHEAASELATRTVDTAARLLENAGESMRTSRAGRKGYRERVADGATSAE
jgi:multimeric flavodoxin WrbA/nitrite reductase/ring-hydroxylating ferredoxin subunit